MNNPHQPVMLIVLDGWGHSEETKFNAIHAANTPVWDKLVKDYPNSVINCSGTDVGLPAGQMGNSEVGHMHIGAGRTIFQDFTRISKAIDEGEFFTNPQLVAAFEQAIESDGTVHILGLLSPGGVHSHEEHILALMEMAKKRGISKLAIHGFLDGRDTPPQSAMASIENILSCSKQQGLGDLASICGRYYAMDRNENWDRVKRAYELLVNGVSEHQYASAVTALESAYERGETDEFVQPSLITNEGRVHRVEDGDVIIFANFRADRARQLTRCFVDPGFAGFERTAAPELGQFVCMTQYSAEFDASIAYPPFELANTFGEVIEKHDLRQLRIAETEKYAHVTFFFNGGVESTFAGEDRALIPSPNVATYDLKPEMSAAEVTDELVKRLADGSYDAIICNYANADMVGHTGNFDATVQCIETLDSCLGRVVSAARAASVDVLITADHGNAEKMRAGDHLDDPHTAHTSNLVPLVYVGRQGKVSSGGCLSDIAPTMLALMGVEIPDEMTGRNLIELTDKRQNAA
ncbi:MAG: 2,3-bisphosphoglycerate-independent phosphoglycerate mutase [Pseudomonadota bacterium]